MSDLRVAEIKRLLQAQCPQLLFELVPGLRREGRLFCGPNPARAGDHASSFKIKPDGRWTEYDSADAMDGRGDIINLIALAGNHAPKSTEGRKYAITWAKQRLGLAGASRQAIEKAKRQASFAKQQADDSERRRAEFLERKKIRILAETHAIARSPIKDAVTLYLAGRGIDLRAIKHRVESLRMHEWLEHWALPAGESWRGPAMVARIMDRDGFTRAIHCTFLHADLRGAVTKAPVANPKLMLGEVKGHVVPICFAPSGLSVAEANAAGISEPVILCEGIETALAEAIGCSDEDGVPQARVWACLSLSNIGNAPVDLACVSAIFVSTENDLKPQALKQRDDAIAKLEAHGKPVITKRVHEGSDAAELLEG